MTDKVSEQSEQIILQGKQSCQQISEEDLLEASSNYAESSF